MNTSAQKMAALGRMNEQVFHARDLASLWLFANANTLHTTLTRYLKKGVLFRIYKGLYSLVPLEKLNPFYLGAKAIHDTCYLSTETVLFEAGYLSQSPTHLTFVSRKSRKFSIAGHHYWVRQIQGSFLYNSLQIEEQEGFRKATVNRAIADLLYFNPYQHFDKAVDWKAVKKLQLELGYPLTPHRYAGSKA